MSPQHLKRRIAALRAALDILAPYDGTQPGRYGPERAAAYKADMERAWACDDGHGYFVQSWLLSPSSRATRVDLSPARAQLAAEEAALAAYEAAASDPRVARMRELEEQLRAEWSALESSMPRAEYLSMLRSGALPRISWH